MFGFGGVRVLGFWVLCFCVYGFRGLGFRLLLGPM